MNDAHLGRKRLQNIPRKIVGTIVSGLAEDLFSQDENFLEAVTVIIVACLVWLKDGSSVDECC
jgi:hypothetical protein